MRTIKLRWKTAFNSLNCISQRTSPRKTRGSKKHFRFYAKKKPERRKLRTVRRWSDKQAGWRFMVIFQGQSLSDFRRDVDDPRRAIVADMRALTDEIKVVVTKTGGWSRVRAYFNSEAILMALRMQDDAGVLKTYEFIDA